MATSRALASVHPTLDLLCKGLPGLFDAQARTVLCRCPACCATAAASAPMQPLAWVKHCGGNAGPWALAVQVQVQGEAATPTLKAFMARGKLLMGGAEGGGRGRGGLPGGGGAAAQQRQEASARPEQRPLPQQLPPQPQPPNAAAGAAAGGFDDDAAAALFDGCDALLGPLAPGRAPAPVAVVAPTVAVCPSGAAAATSLDAARGPTFAAPGTPPPPPDASALAGTGAAAHPLPASAGPEVSGRQPRAGRGRAHALSRSELLAAPATLAAAAVTAAAGGVGGMELGPASPHLARQPHRSGGTNGGGAGGQGGGIPAVQAVKPWTGAPRRQQQQQAAGMPEPGGAIDSQPPAKKPRGGTADPPTYDANGKLVGSSGGGAGGTRPCTATHIKAVGGVARAKGEGVGHPSSLLPPMMTHVCAPALPECRPSCINPVAPARCRSTGRSLAGGQSPRGPWPRPRRRPRVRRSVAAGLRWSRAAVTALRRRPGSFA